MHDGRKNRGDGHHRRERDVVRVSAEVARALREGHPWVFRDALQGRKLRPDSVVAGVDIVDPSRVHLGRALYDPAGAIALRVYTRAAGQAFDSEHLEGAVVRAARLRRQTIGVGAEGCSRVLNGDVEGVPAVNVDRYGPFLVVVAYNRLVEGFLDELVAALDRVWRPRGIYLQQRYRPAAEGKARPGAELVAGQAAPPELVVTEGRARYVVDVTAPLGTGLFADMRLGRAEVARLAPGRRVLNCFSYTGAFSLVAALHGAASVVSVDSAPRAHGRARRNFGENGIDSEGRWLQFITGDVFATLARMASRSERFDLVILDPPTFSTGKGRPFASMQDYAALTGAAVAVIDPAGGVLCAATNTAKLGAAELDRALARGAAEAGRSMVVIARVGQPADFPSAPGFPEGNYLKFVAAQVW